MNDSKLKFIKRLNSRLRRADSKYGSDNVVSNSIRKGIRPLGLYTTKSGYISTSKENINDNLISVTDVTLDEQSEKLMPANIIENAIDNLSQSMRDSIIGSNGKVDISKLTKNANRIEGINRTISTLFAFYASGHTSVDLSNLNENEYLQYEKATDNINAYELSDIVRNQLKNPEYDPDDELLSLFENFGNEVLNADQFVEGLGYFTENGTLTGWSSEWSNSSVKF